MNIIIIIIIIILLIIVFKILYKKFYGSGVGVIKHVEHGNETFFMKEKEIEMHNEVYNTNITNVNTNKKQQKFYSYRDKKGNEDKEFEELYKAELRIDKKMKILYYVMIKKLTDDVIKNFYYTITDKIQYKDKNNNEYITQDKDNNDYKLSDTLCKVLPPNIDTMISYEFNENCPGHLIKCILTDFVNLCNYYFDEESKVTLKIVIDNNDKNDFKLSIENDKCELKCDKPLNYYSININYTNKKETEKNNKDCYKEFFEFLYTSTFNIINNNVKDNNVEDNKAKDKKYKYYYYNNLTPNIICNFEEILTQTNKIDKNPIVEFINKLLNDGKIKEEDKPKLIASLYIYLCNNKEEKLKSINLSDDELKKLKDKLYDDKLIKKIKSYNNELCEKINEYIKIKCFLQNIMKNSITTKLKMYQDFTGDHNLTCYDLLNLSHDNTNYKFKSNTLTFTTKIGEDKTCNNPDGLLMFNNKIDKEKENENSVDTYSEHELKKTVLSSDEDNHKRKNSNENIFDLYINNIPEEIEYSEHSLNDIIEEKEDQETNGLISFINNTNLIY